MSSKVNLLALLAFLLTCCATPKVVQDYQRDSVVVIVKDSLVLRDSVVLVEIPIESRSERLVVAEADTSVLETSVARSEAFVAEGKLHHTLTNKEALIPIKVTIPEKVHTELRAKALVHREVVEVEKELSRWQNFIQMLGYGVLIACVLWLINKVRKIVA